MTALAMSDASAPGAPASSARKRILIAGEFSSGKSTCLNLLARRRCSGPSAVSLRASLTSHRFACTLQTDQTGEMSLPLLSSLDDTGKQLVSPGDTDVVELLEAQILSAEALTPEDLQRLGPIDHILWCTIGSQAWRSSEKSSFEVLSDACSCSATLAVTRSDLFRSSADLMKIQSRLQHEAARLFNDIVFIGWPMRTEQDLANDEVWRSGGGEVLSRAVLSHFYSGADPSREENAPSVSPSGPSVDTDAPQSEHIAPQEDAVGGSILQERENPKTENMADRPDKVCVDPNKVEKSMPTNLEGLEQISGFIGACLVDSDTGLMLGSVGGGSFDLEAAGAANTSVVQAKLNAIQTLGLDDEIEDILITLGKQFHLIRPLADTPTVFLYLALDKKAANLGMARIQLKKVESEITL